MTSNQCEYMNEGLFFCTYITKVLFWAVTSIQVMCCSVGPHTPSADLLYIIISNYINNSVFFAVLHVNMTLSVHQVACMQFINIVVHSVENMNFRVYLQYEFTQHGLDDYLEASLTFEPTVSKCNKI